LIDIAVDWLGIQPQHAAMLNSRGRHNGSNRYPS
jgi:hypothetical protein